MEYKVCHKMISSSLLIKKNPQMLRSFRVSLKETKAHWEKCSDSYPSMRFKEFGHHKRLWIVTAHTTVLSSMEQQSLGNRHISWFWESHKSRKRRIWKDTRLQDCNRPHVIQQEFRLGSRLKKFLCPEPSLAEGRVGGRVEMCSRAKSQPSVKVPL